MRAAVCLQTLLSFFFFFGFSFLLFIYVFPLLFTNPLYWWCFVSPFSSATTPTKTLFPSHFFCLFKFSEKKQTKGLCQGCIIPTSLLPELPLLRLEALQMLTGLCTWLYRCICLPQPMFNPSKIEVPRRKIQSWAQRFLCFNLVMLAKLWSFFWSVMWALVFVVSTCQSC